MTVAILHNDKIILKDVIIADKFWCRLSGYMFRKKAHVPGILFIASGSMQTTFMRFNIDIVFLNNKDTVVKVLKEVKPWRCTKIYSNVSKILEVPSGVLPSTLNQGDILKVV